MHKASEIVCIQSKFCLLSSDTKRTLLKKKSRRNHKVLERPSLCSLLIRSERPPIELRRIKIGPFNFLIDSRNIFHNKNRQKRSEILALRPLA